MKKVTYSEFRKNTKQALDNVVEKGQVLIVNLGRNKNAVIISLQEYNAINETFHLLSSTKNAIRLFDAIKRDKKDSNANY